jgi:hypothetical protein
MNIVFVDIGEGLHGDYDPDDPTDVALLRLDYLVNGEEVESACTQLPTSTTENQQAAALSLVHQFVAAHPATSPKRVVDIFSWLDESWLEAGQCGADNLLIALGGE